MTNFAGSVDQAYPDYSARVAFSDLRKALKDHKVGVPVRSRVPVSSDLETLTDPRAD